VDGGATWQSMVAALLGGGTACGSHLPALHLSPVVHLPCHTGYIYATVTSTALRTVGSGVLRSGDRGLHWQVMLRPTRVGPFYDTSRSPVGGVPRLAVLLDNAARSYNVQ